MSSINEQELLKSRSRERWQKILSFLGSSSLFSVTLLSATGIIFILLFIFKDALPFFQMKGIGALFASDQWYPEGDPSPTFGARGIVVGSALVTIGSCAIAVPLGVTAAICLSDVIPFTLRQIIKPVIELLAAIPSVAYGFFALVVFAPVLQEQGGTLLAWGMWVILGPLAALISIVLGDLLSSKLMGRKSAIRWFYAAVFLGLFLWGLTSLGVTLDQIKISNGVNALNASILLAVMALPTIVSVCEDSLTAVGRSLREGSYALGATRAETMVKVIIPSASGGIVAAIILGIMRAIGETMVVLMAAGNSFEVPEPWFNFLEGVRTLTATIALEMGETDQTAGAPHYHSLFALGFYLLIFSFICNVVSEWAVRRTKRRLKGL